MSLAEPHQLPLFRPVTGRQIIAEVAEKYRLKVSDLTGHRRYRDIAWPRQEAMWRMREETKLSLPQIGSMFGGRDHTSVLYAIRAHAKRMGQE